MCYMKWALGAIASPTHCLHVREQDLGGAMGRQKKTCADTAFLTQGYWDRIPAWAGPIPAAFASSAHVCVVVFRVFRLSPHHNIHISLILQSVYLTNALAKIWSWSLGDVAAHCILRMGLIPFSLYRFLKENSQDRR